MSALQAQRDMEIGQKFSDTSSAALPKDVSPLQWDLALEKLLQGQQRLEDGMDEVLRRIRERAPHNNNSVRRSERSLGAPATWSQPAREKSAHSVQCAENDESLSCKESGCLCLDIEEVPTMPTKETQSFLEDDEQEFQLRPVIQEYALRCEQIGYDVAVETTKEAALRTLTHTVTKKNRNRSFADGIWKAAGGLNRSSLDLGSHKKGSSRFMIHPASGLTSMMDILTCVFMLLDVAVVPYLMAWQPPLEDFRAMAIVVTIFWSLDMVLNFRTGYVRADGLVVMNAWQVARKYCMRAFAFDFTVVTAEVINLVIGYANARGATPHIQRALRLVKVIRFFRILRKLRAGMLARLHEAFLRGMHIVGYLHWLPMLDLGVLVLKLFFAITLIGHVGACVWHGMEASNAVNDEQDSWKRDQEGVMPSYIRGFYWAVSTVFSGGSHLNPLNIFEAVLSLVWLVLGALFVTSVTSTMAATLIESQSRQQDASTKVQALTTFLHQRHAPMRLAMALHSDLMRKLEDPVSVSEKDLPMQLVAPRLRASLREALYAPPLLQASGFFRMISAVQDGFVLSVCFNAADVMVSAAGETIFHQRQEFNSAILITRGLFVYTAANSMKRHSLYVSAATTLTANAPKEEDAVEEGALVCELALILQWHTRGRLFAQTAGEVFSISAELFVKEVMEYPAVAVVVASFGVRLCQHSKADESLLEESCSDLEIGLDYDFVASGLHQAIRVTLLSQPILESLQQQHLSNFFAWRSRKSLLELEHEVQAGKCHLVKRGAHESQGCLRIMRIVLLHLRNPDGLLCVQLAHYCRGGGVDSLDMNFPGGKVLGNETPEDGIHRLINDRLRPFKSCISIVSSHTKIEVQASASFGITTKYIKTIFEAELAGEFANDAPIPIFRKAVMMGGNLSDSSTMSISKVGSLSKPANGSRKTTPLLQQTFDILVGDSCFHGFAVGGSRTSNRGGELDSNADRLSGKGSTNEDDIFLYQWFNAEDAHSLHLMPGDSEADLHAILRRSDVTFWQRLMGWHIASESSQTRVSRI